MCTGLQWDQPHIVHFWGPRCVITVYFYSLDIKYAKNYETKDLTFQLDPGF